MFNNPAFAFRKMPLSPSHESRCHAETIAMMTPSIVPLTGDVPIIADGDTSFGGPVMVERTVQLYAMSGISAIHIQDKRQPAFGKCPSHSRPTLTPSSSFENDETTPTGERAGGESGQVRETEDLYSLPAFLSRIRAAVSARLAIGSDACIIARTDCLSTLGHAEAITRLRAARDCGADAGMLDGVTSKAQAAAVVSQMEGWPMILNMVYGQDTPPISVLEAEQMGYRGILFPLVAINEAFASIWKGLNSLKSLGELRGEGTRVPKGIEQGLLLEGLMDVARHI